MMIMSVTAAGLALCASLFTPPDPTIISCQDDPERVADFLFWNWSQRYGNSNIIGCPSVEGESQWTCARVPKVQGECFTPLTFTGQARGYYLFCKPPEAGS